MLARPGEPAQVTFHLQLDPEAVFIFHGMPVQVSGTLRKEGQTVVGMVCWRNVEAGSAEECSSTNELGEYFLVLPAGDYDFFTPLNDRQHPIHLSLRMGEDLYDRLVTPANSERGLKGKQP